MANSKQAPRTGAPDVVAGYVRGTLDTQKVHTLSSGVKVRLRSVSPGLVAQVVSKVKAPPVPTWHDEEHDRDEYNPGDPEYQRLLRETDTERSRVAQMVICLFGIDLVDGMPEDETWVRKLRLVGIEATDDDEIEREMLYKAYIAVASVNDLTFVMQASGVSQEAIQKEVEDTFRGDAARDANPGGGA